MLERHNLPKLKQEETDDVNIDLDLLNKLNILLITFPN